MKFIRKALTVLSFAAMLITFTALGNDALAQNKGQRRHGPPPEAYAACEGKSAGDAAEFVSPRGDTVTGTCEERDDRLVLRPDHHPGGKHRNNSDN